MDNCEQLLLAQMKIHATTLSSGPAALGQHLLTCAGWITWPKLLAMQNLVKSLVVQPLAPHITLWGIAFALHFSGSVRYSPSPSPISPDATTEGRGRGHRNLSCPLEGMQKGIANRNLMGH